MEVSLDADPGLERPLVVIAFPTTGLVGVVAAHVLVRRLALPLVGSIRSHRLAPTVLVRGGEWTPPIAIYGKKMACGLDGASDGLLLVAGHVALDRELYWDMARELGEFFAQRNVQMTVLLRSQVGADHIGPPKVFSVAQGDLAKTYAKAVDAEPMNDGLVRGVSGAWLVDAQRRGAEALVLVAESRRGHRDHIAAVEVLRGLAKLLAPMRGIPLEDEAIQIEDEILRSERSTAMTEQRARNAVTQMYH